MVFKYIISNSNTLNSKSQPPFYMANTQSGRLIVSVDDYLSTIGYDTAFAPFTCGGAAYSGRTPDGSHNWNYGGGIILKRGTNSATALWMCEDAYAIGYGDAEAGITWHVYE